MAFLLIFAGIVLIVAFGWMWLTATPVYGPLSDIYPPKWLKEERDSSMWKRADKNLLFLLFFGIGLIIGGIAVALML
jgi:hypothetical protein